MRFISALEMGCQYSVSKETDEIVAKKIKLRLAALFLIHVFAVSLVGCAGAPHKVEKESEPVDQKISSLDEKTKEDEAAHHFSLAQAFSLEGNSEKAIEEYKVALIYDSDSPVLHTRLATEYVRRGLLTLAIDECKNAIKADGKYVDARLLLAGLYGATKLSQQALAEYDAVLKTDSKNVEAYVFKGSLLLEENRAADAIQTLKKLVQLDSENHLGYYYLGKAEQQLGKTDAAVKYYRRALEIKPGNPQAVMSLGMLFEEKKNLAEAVKVYEEGFSENRDAHVAARLAQIAIDKSDYKGALKYLLVLEHVDEDNLNVKVKIGLIYLELKNFDKAGAEFEAILAKTPEAERVRFYLASVYQEGKAYDKAIQVLSQVDSNSSSFADAAVHIGFLHKLKGDNKQALRWIDRAIEQNSQVAQYYTFKASVLDDLKQPSDAVAVLNEGLEKNPPFALDEKYLYYLGSLQEKNGDQQKALDTMKRLLEVNPNNANALNYIGYTLASRGENMRAAESMVRRALAIKPRDGFIQDSLGYILLKKGQTKEATRELEKAYALRPDEPVILEHLGDAYYKSNMRFKAMEKYKEAAGLVADPVEREKLERKFGELQAEGGASSRGFRKTAGESAD